MNLSINKIVASTMLRARQTAKIIARKIDLPIEPSHLFIERRKPNEQDEIDQESIQAIQAKKMTKENFNDLKERVRNALDYLGTLQE